jgi:predicted MPP superfamily phosphohydrolase
VSDLILIITCLVPVYFYLSIRLSSHWSHWIFLAGLFLLILSFPFKNKFRYQLQLIYFGMGSLSYILIFTLLRDVIFLTTNQLSPAWAVMAMSSLCLVLGFLKASRGPIVKKINVPIENLPENLNGFKIAQISDLHIGATIRKSYVEGVVKKVNEQGAQLIALTGDIGDGMVKHYRLDVSPLGKLKSSYGSFFIPGNHEYYWNVNEWLTVMNNLGIINLVNRGKVIQHRGGSVLIAGIPDPVGGIAPDLLGVQDSASGDKADFRILLSHRPGIAQEAARNGFDLQLSGHTHAGQFFPRTLVVKMVHRISYGLHKVGSMWIYVNPGTGSWGPHLRLGTTPEITLLTLTQSKASVLLSEKQ